jgi:aryl-alcohol dehydrogenase-like predicted oxidoreductase
MEYRQLGKSEIQVPEITFGAWAIGGWMWGGTDRKGALEAIYTAIDEGITAIDTAPIYGFGTSEEILGEVLSSIPRDRIVLMTKFGMRWDLEKGSFYFKTRDNDGKEVNIYKYSSAESIVYECEQSLKRLKTDYIDLYQIHWPDITTPIEESMIACEKLVQSGKVRVIGVSNFSISQMAEAENVLYFASNQVPYSMINRDIENDVVPYCLNNNVGILAYSPLQRGFLTGKIKTDHNFNPGDHRANSSYFKKNKYIKILELLKKIEPIAIDKNASLAQLVIKWTLQQPGITSVLVGARKKSHVMENVKAADISLSRPEIEQINTRLNELKVLLS